jgi:hypothetical protein
MLAITASWPSSAIRPLRYRERRHRPARLRRLASGPVRGNRFGARVQTLLDNSLRSRMIITSVSPQPPAGCVMRPPKPRLEGHWASQLISSDHLLQPVPRDPVVARHIALGPALDRDGGSDQLGQSMLHLRAMRCRLSPETGANYVVPPVIHPDQGA